MSSFCRKTHMLWVEDEPQVCLWCKKKCHSNELTLEHVNGRTIEPKKRVIKLACKKCNSVHGGIMSSFTDMLNGKITLGNYQHSMRKLSISQGSFLKIINNGWFQISLDRFRDHPKFRHNPTKLTYARISFVSNGEILVPSSNDEFAADAFFSRRVQSKSFLWRLNHASLP